MRFSQILRIGLKIPKRIERGPTDILRALASTVKYIPTEPDTLLHDDPFLMPLKSLDRTHFSLSKLSGANTAKFLINKHPELFYRDDAEPKIRAFMPPEQYREDMSFTVEDLRWCIEHEDPVNGVIAYKALVDKDHIKLDQELLLQFFEMICYTNEDPMLDLFEQQKSYYANESDRLVKQNWNDTGVASKIFNQIKQDLNSSRVYSAMIAGLCKHNEHRVAKEIFDEFKEFHPQQGLYVEAYDFLISSIPNLNSSVTTAHEALDDVVRHMEQHLVIPNLRVFNSILEVYRKFNCDTNICQKAFQLMTDMRSLGIEPSPFTYSCLMNIINKARESSKHSRAFEGLLDYMLTNDDSLIIRDERDTQFLMSAMNLTANRYNNLQLSSKIFNIYLKRPNLFPSKSIQTIFFDVYFRLLLTTESLENIMKFYDSYVPMQFKPTKETYELLAELLEMYGLTPKL